jgi:hypothetical protein
MRHALAAAAAALLTLALAPAAHAAKGGTCAAFSVTVNGTTYSGDQKRTIAAPINSIQVRGTYITFNVVPSSFTTLNYAHTGKASPRADKNLPINGRTVIFTRKQPVFSGSLTGPLSLTLGNESLVLERAGGRQHMKIQAKDCHQGGLFQLEPEPGVPEVNTLGPGFHYTSQPPGQTRLCWTNGRFSGYDSPELATLASFSPTVARWNVQAGGRIGAVFGEDALEGGCPV